jgi:hypothetical protein
MTYDEPYTPSRSEVRKAYIASREFAFLCDEDHRRLARAEFDRWLAKERRKAKAEDDLRRCRCWFV